MTPAELYKRQHAIYERRIYPIFLRGLRKQIEPVIVVIERGDLHPDLDELVRPDAMHMPMIQAYDMIGQLAAKREYYAISGMEQKGLIQFLVDKWRLIFHNYALNYAYRVDSELAEVTKEELRKGLAESYEQNLSTDQTARYIRKKVQNQISKTRAVLIASTEATTASNLGKRAGGETWLQQQGQKGYKQWLGREDSRERGFLTDHGHWALNNKVIPLEEEWRLIDDKGVVSYCQNPGDVSLPANQRCRCRCTQSIISERLYLRLVSEGTYRNP